jgi:hypothetical protein
MKIMVAKQALGTVTITVQPTQYPKVVWPTVDQIAQYIQGVSAGGKFNFPQQVVQRRCTALNIADHILRHGIIVIQSGAKALIKGCKPWMSC